jgi:hypothetical protein
MEKLPLTSQKSKIEWDKSQSLLAAATDRKIRNIIETRKSGAFFDPKYVHVPAEKIQITDANEITSQLSLLRRCMDKERISFTRGDARLHRVRSEDSKIEYVIMRRKLTIGNLHIAVREVENKVVKTLEMQCLEEENQEVYNHVLDRMRTTIVFLKRKYFKLDQNIRLQGIHLTQSVAKSTKAKEAKNTIFQAFSIFKDETSFEISSKQKELEKVDKDVGKQKELSENRLAHRKMQEEMREKAMIEDHSSQLEGIREKYLLHFMWHMVSTIRFQSEQVKWKRYEDAFLRIKLATGIHDIPLLVEKYLTKEQIYSDFLFSVKKKEKELVDYQQKIKKLQKNIDKLNQIDDLQIEKSKFEEMGLIRKQVFEESSKMKQLVIVQNKIQDWCQKFITKVAVFNRDQEDFQKNDLKKCFFHVKDVALKVMKNLRNDQEKFINVHNLIENSKLSGIVEKVPQGSRLKKSRDEKIELSELMYIENEEMIKKHK